VRRVLSAPDPSFDLSVDFAERFGKSVEDEVSKFFDSVISSSSMVDEVSSKFIGFLAWWYQRTKAYRKFLDRIFTQPREGTVSFVLRTGANEPPRVVTVGYSAYDLVEMITLNRILRNDESRRKLVDLLVEMVKNGTVKLPDGNMYTTKNYVENVLGVKWVDFEKKLRERIEADINAYLHEIDNTEGSRLAKHIWLRDNSLRNGESTPWLFLFGQLSTMTLLLIHANVYASRNMWILKYMQSDYRRAALKYYSHIGRFKVVADSLTDEVIGEMNVITRKGISEKAIEFIFRKRYDYSDVMEAAKHGFDELRKLFAETARSIPYKLIPGDFVAQILNVKLNPKFVESVAKSNIKTEEEDISVNA